MVQAGHPGALFAMMPYMGYFTKACAARLEKHIKDWVASSLTSEPCSIWAAQSADFRRQ
jgi:hypothetical protein